MKDIVLITDHPTNEKRLDNLLNLILRLKDGGKKVALASHILIPEYIVSKCDYFLYDKENELDIIVEKENSPRQKLYMGNYIFNSFEFLVPNKNKDYRYSCLKQFLQAFNYLKNLEYDIIHFVEGDVLVDMNEMLDNYNILSSGNYDSVIYTSSICMCGGYFSFSTKNINISEFLPINKEKIKNHINNYTLLENFTRNEIFKNYNHYIKNYHNYNFLNGISTLDDSKRIRHSFFMLNGKWSFLLWNPGDNTLNIELTSSINNLNSNFKLNSTMTNIISVDKISDNDVLYLFVNGNLHRKYELEPSMFEFRFNFVEINE